MSDTYNLDQDVPEHFSFILSGHEYRMRYPTTEETTKAQNLKANSDEQMEWLYSFIEPVKADSPTIQEALQKVNVKKLMKFTKMISDEFSSEV